MAEFFRFRSIDALLGKFQELEEQTIYFASPEELNDPMEGLRNIVWNGDEIVWTNFFKHYVFCLNRIFLLFNITRNPRKLDVAEIPILERWDDIITPTEKCLFGDIWYRVYNLPSIQEIIEAIVNTKHKIKYREIVWYLHRMQNPILLDVIQKTYIDHVFKLNATWTRPVEESVVEKEMKHILKSIKQVESIEDEGTRDDRLQGIEKSIDNKNLEWLINAPEYAPHILEDRNRILIYDFPRLYVEQLHRLLWPDWYTACFTKSFHNSSVWAKYADGHKGVCLIFEAIENDNSNSLELNDNSITLPFCKVNYTHIPDETDFFRTICRPDVPTITELWYTNQNGNTSECATHLESDQSQSAWRERCWNNFYRHVTFKTKDWKYEQEYRLILENTSGQFDSRDDRKLTYDFNSLKGIIFGMRTSTEDQLKIIEIIEKKKKCPKNNQADFKYFQAYPSDIDGDIRKRERKLG